MPSKNFGPICIHLRFQRLRKYQPSTTNPTALSLQGVDPILFGLVRGIGWPIYTLLMPRGVKSEPMSFDVINAFQHMHMTTKGRVRSRWPHQWGLNPATPTPQKSEVTGQTPERKFSIQCTRCCNRTTSHGLFRIANFGLFRRFKNFQGARIWPGWNWQTTIPRTIFIPKFVHIHLCFDQPR